MAARLPLLLCACMMMPTGSLSLLVTVQDKERYTLLFSSIVLKCDYSTSVEVKDVTVTWRFKSFCMDPIFDYYSAAFQASLSLGRDPADDCNDSKREVRTIIQRRGQNEPMLGAEYRQRKITLRDRADLVISEVMWWDHGVYFCSVEATGDSAGDPDKEVKLVVLHWLTVIFIVLGGLLLFTLFAVCCCQCCPQCCPCYVRCPCCPTKCCCPEEALARHRYMKEAASVRPWMMDKPIYIGGDRNSQHSSYQLNPLLQRDISRQNSFPINYPPPPPPISNKVLDFLESEIKNLNTAQPMLVGAPYSGGSHHPSMLSSLGEVGVREMDRRVIQLPPIVEHVPASQRTSNTSHQRINAGGIWDPLEEERERRRNHFMGDSRSGGSSLSYNRGSHDQPRDDRLMGRRGETYNSGRSRRDESPVRRQGPANHNEDFPYSSSRGRPNLRSDRRLSPDRREYHSARRGSPDRPSGPRDHRRSYSPPSRRDSWSSEEEYERPRGRGGRRHERTYEEEKPPSYRSLDVTTGKGQNPRAGTERQSERGSSRSGRSVVI
ncbi:immunoglobulin-like domain-containing receptor 1 [Ambystoma mexicanum]|uniref:immunoglobulin-like domain-containing receptor 1 n=1 Tax=Ambystoma mexicanum TaxID=8296 RepID=UPI0037E86A4D